MIKLAKIFAVLIFLAASNSYAAGQLSEPCRVKIRKHGTSWIRSIDEAKTIFQADPNNASYKKSMAQGEAVKSAINAVLKLKPVNAAQVQILEKRCDLSLDLPESFEPEAAGSSSEQKTAPKARP